MLTDDAGHKNVPPPLDLTRILKSYQGMIEGMSHELRA